MGRRICWLDSDESSLTASHRGEVKISCCSERAAPPSVDVVPRPGLVPAVRGLAGAYVHLMYKRMFNVYLSMT